MMIREMLPGHCDDYISKPVRRQLLLDKIQKMKQQV